MAGTRSSARNADSNPKAGDKKTPSKAAAGTKRKAETGSSPENKRGKKATPKKEQKTLEETMPQDEEDQPKDIEMQEAADEGEGTDKKADASGKPAENPAGSCWFWADQNTYSSSIVPKTNGKGADADAGAEDQDVKDDEEALRQAEEDTKADDQQDTKADGKAQNGDVEEATTTVDPKDGAIEKASQDRADAMPSNVMEKGIIYFFT
ncbi:hypothetical protein LTS18_003119, partial [Coniosporium uncinatum]